MDSNKKRFVRLYVLIVFAFMGIMIYACDPLSSFVGDDIYVQNLSSQKILFSASLYNADSITATPINVNETKLVMSPNYSQSGKYSFANWLGKDSITVYTIDGVKLKTWYGPFFDDDVSNHVPYNKLAWTEVPTVYKNGLKRGVDLITYEYTFVITDDDLK
jgi:hypothetical protein